MTGKDHEAQARVVINATGAFCDDVRRMSERQAPDIVTLSQGTHLVLDGSFLPGNDALMIPKDERRARFLPSPGTALRSLERPTRLSRTRTWNPRRLSPRSILFSRPRPVLAKKPGRRDILSIFTGIRPLVKSGENEIRLRCRAGIRSRSMVLGC